MTLMKTSATLTIERAVNKALTVRYQTELEIWGKAQRESALRPKSDWGKLEGGGKEEGRISPASKSRGPNLNALAYAERALST